MLQPLKYTYALIELSCYNALWHYNQTKFMISQLHYYIFLAADVACTLDNVRAVIKNVEWNLLCKCLCVPESKIRNICEEYPFEQQRRVLVEWWLLNDPAAS